MGLIFKVIAKQDCVEKAQRGRKRSAKYQPIFKAAELLQADNALEISVKNNPGLTYNKLYNSAYKQKDIFEKFAISRRQVKDDVLIYITRR